MTLLVYKDNLKTISEGNPATNLVILLWPRYTHRLSHHSSYVSITFLGEWKLVIEVWIHNHCSVKSLPFICLVLRTTEITVENERPFFFWIDLCGHLWNDTGCGDVQATILKRIAGPWKGGFSVLLSWASDLDHFSSPFLGWFVLLYSVKTLAQHL